MKPLFDRALILYDEPESTTKGGIIIPSTVNKRDAFIEATVLEIGEKCKLVNKGNKVLVFDKIGLPITIEKDGENKIAYLIRESEIHAIVNE